MQKMRTPQLTTAIFPTLPDLVDFQMITNQCKAQVDLACCALTGLFTEADLELAINGYQACTLLPGQERGTGFGLTFSPQTPNGTHD